VISKAEVAKEKVTPKKTKKGKKGAAVCPRKKEFREFLSF
jgi:hypothetical protein